MIAFVDSITSVMIDIFALSQSSVYLGLLVAHFTSAPVACHLPSRQTNLSLKSKDTARPQQVSDDSGQRRAISSQASVSNRKFPLVGLRITLDRPNVVRFALQSHRIALTDKIISQNAIELFLVGVEVRGCPLIFEIVSWPKHLLVIRRRRSLRVNRVHSCWSLSVAVRGQMFVFSAGLLLLGGAFIPANASFGARIAAAIEMARIPRMKAPTIPRIQGHAPSFHRQYPEERKHSAAGKVRSNRLVSVPRLKRR
jgi:hypothetical protein